jgi:hypothetical protein
MLGTPCSEKSEPKLEMTPSTVELTHSRFPLYKLHLRPIGLSREKKLQNVFLVSYVLYLHSYLKLTLSQRHLHELFPSFST